MIQRSEATPRVLAAKGAKDLTFAQIAERVGRDVVWTTSALLGQQSLSAEEAASVAEMLELDEETTSALQQYPLKGALDLSVPVDPLIYRFHEITQVYGTTLKAVIHEMFGDGIMSAIDFELKVARKADPKGDRVVVTMDGKFLPYRKW